MWGIAILAAGTLGLVTACGSGGISASPGSSSKAVSKAVPDFVGKGLQTAEDDAQSAGFGDVSSYDASGRGRIQILATDWKVCFQSPAAGVTASTGSKVGLGVVKLDESCPAADQGAQTPPPVSEGQPMPGLAGKSLTVAIRALPSGTSIRARDVSGKHRVIIIQSNWKICTQRPAAGATFSGQPVTLGVVKYGEPCP